MKNRIKVPSLAALLLGLLLLGGASGASGALAASPFAPLAGWSAPQNVSQANTYSNTPALASLQTTGAPVMSWEERDIPSQADFSLLQTAKSTCGDCAMNAPSVLAEAGFKEIGNVAAVHDATGGVHFAWFQYDAAGIAIYYGRYANGAWSNIGPVELTRSFPWAPKKMVALAVGPDNQIWLLNGRDEVNLNLYRSPDGVQWFDEGGLPTGARPKDVSLAVATGGQVMAAWIDRNPAYDTNGDAFAALYNGNRQWQVFHVSATAGQSTHNTSLAADRTGGIRMVYDSVTTCSGDNCYEDVFYREWTPAGGFSPNIANISNNAGSSYQPIVRVDSSNVAWIVWMDDTNRSYHNYILLWASGSGTTFTNPGIVVDFGNAQVKDAALDTSPGFVQLGFSSTVSDPQRDNFYTSLASGPPPTATPTNTAVPTETATSTATPLVTPTIRPDCLFFDVCQDAWYFPFVDHLVDMGAIAGYSDLRFRPNNTVTRGQVAKILVTALGLPIDTAGGPHFNDVSANNPFYSFIETAAKRNIVGGYSDGSFKPFNEVTRSQLAKMVVVARGYELYDPATPSFSDVSRSNAFFGFIETANHMGIISGYSDGTFKPFSTATRAQGSKIIDSARLISGATSTPTVTNTAVPSSTATPTRTATTAPGTATRTASATSTATSTATPVNTATATATLVPLSMVSFDPDNVLQDDFTTEVTLTGAGFGASGPNSDLQVNGISAQIVEWTDTSVVFTVSEGTPAMAATTVMMQRNDMATGNSDQFTVVPTTPLDAPATIGKQGER